MDLAANLFTDSAVENICCEFYCSVINDCISNAMSVAQTSLQKFSGFQKTLFDQNQAVIKAGVALNCPENHGFWSVP